MFSFLKVKNTNVPVAKACVLTLAASYRLWEQTTGYCDIMGNLTLAACKLTPLALKVADSGAVKAESERTAFNSSSLRFTKHEKCVNVPLTIPFFRALLNSQLQ